MNNKKLLGFTFLTAAIAGILFCIFATIQVWRFKPAAVTITADTLDVLMDTLLATQDGLVVIDEMIQTTSRDVALFETTVQTITITIEDTNSLLDSLETLTDTDLPATISATQTSLTSAQTSAQLIDNMMSALASIPLLGLDVYQPDVPLNTAIGDISESLDPLAPTLRTMSDVLAGSAENLDDLKTDLQLVSETTVQLKAALEEAQGVIGDYQDITTGLVERVTNLQKAAPANIQAVSWLLTFFLIALLFAQIGLGERGITLIREGSSRTIDER